MSSKLAYFRQLEKQLASQLAQLDELKNDESLKKEIEFENKLRALMEEYGVSEKAVLNLLGGVTESAAPTGKSQRKPRAVKKYVNPHNGETVETKGGNHSVLKKWKEQYGHETVESWLQK